jgi:cbb3-type cytochrome oxidase subunit 3
MALGVIVLTIILAAGVPMIQKMKDKNSFSQAKTVFFTLNQNVNDVINEGPASRRYMSPFEIKSGEFTIDGATDLIIWSMKTKAKMMEPSYDFKGNPTDIPEFQEGDLYLYAQDTNIVDEYIASLKLDYTGIAHLQLESPFSGPFAGTYSLTVEHTGTYEDNLPVIKIKIMP